jgi:hypothetical protein
LTKINPNAFGAAEPVAARSQPPLQVGIRTLPEITRELLSRAAPGLLLELRESFYNEWEQWQEPELSRDPLVSAHRESQGEVWDTIARRLGLPEHSGGGYR